MEQRHPLEGDRPESVHEVLVLACEGGEGGADVGRGGGETGVGDFVGWGEERGEEDGGEEEVAEDVAVGVELGRSVLVQLQEMEGEGKGVTDHYDGVPAHGDHAEAGVELRYSCSQHGPHSPFPPLPSRTRRQQSHRAQHSEVTERDRGQVVKHEIEGPPTGWTPTPSTPQQRSSPRRRIRDSSIKRLQDEE